MMILNLAYYRELLNSASGFNDCVYTKKTAYLSAFLIISNYSKLNVHINIPNDSEIYNQTLSIIFRKISIEIFKNYADFPLITIGSRWKNKEKPKYSFEITDYTNDMVTLYDRKSGMKIFTNEYKLYKKYWPAQNRNIQPIKEYRDSYKNHSEWFDTFGSIPTSFSKKSVFISSKSIWETYRKYDTPSIYIPNKRESNQTVIKSIPALDDCIAYFTPKYEVCFEELLNKGIQIDTIILCDNDLERLPQILQDQKTFNFKLIILSNKSENNKFNKIRSWCWRKEELNVLEQI